MEDIPRSGKKRGGYLRGMVRLLCAAVAIVVTVALLGGAAGLFDRNSGVGTSGSVDANASSGQVLLISAAHPLPKGYQPPRLVRLAGKVPVSGKTVRVAASIATPLLDLFAAAREAGISGLYVISGYRSSDEQSRLWKAARDKSYVQRPGSSEHQSGLAVDLGVLGQTNGDLADSSAGQWLAANSWRYGFILRYPPDKRAITGISYEPWHFRYVGTRVAKACYRGGLTLEEYLNGGS